MSCRKCDSVTHAPCYKCDETYCEKHINVKYHNCQGKNTVQKEPSATKLFSRLDDLEKKIVENKYGDFINDTVSMKSLEDEETIQEMKAKIEKLENDLTQVLAYVKASEEKADRVYQESLENIFSKSTQAEPEYIPPKLQEIEGASELVSKINTLEATLEKILKQNEVKKTAVAKPATKTSTLKKKSTTTTSSDK